MANEKIVDFRKKFNDFYEGVPFWMAIADGEILHFCPEGYEDEEERVFDTFGYFMFQRERN